MVLRVDLIWKWSRVGFAASHLPRCLRWGEKGDFFFIPKKDLGYSFPALQCSSGR